MKNIIKKTIKTYLFEEFVKDISLSSEQINQIMKGYLECALWTEEDNLKDQVGYGDEVDDEDLEDDIEKLINLQNKLNKQNIHDFVTDNIDPDSKIQSYLDIKQFIKDAGKDAIDEVLEDNDLFKLGMNIWFTRNHHGSGFFDHSPSYKHEKELIDAGQKLREVNLYIDGYGKIHFE